MKKHQLTAVVLSVIFTGLGLFYIGTPMLIITGALLMALQGAVLYFLLLTLGFLGFLALPAALALHIAGIVITIIYFTYRSPKKPWLEQKRQRQLSSPGAIAARTVIGLLLLAGSVYVGYTEGTAPFTKSAAEKQVVREAAEQYLEQKYGEPFKVTKMDYIWAVGSYNLTAIPEGAPELEFTLDSTDGSPPVPSGETYLNRVWGAQLRDKAEPVIDRLYPDGAFVQAWVSCNMKQVVREYDKLDSCSGEPVSQNVDIVVFADVAEGSLDQEKERLLELVKQLPGVTVPGKTDLQIEYYPAKLNTPANAAKLEKGSGALQDATPTYQFREFDISRITGTSDIELRKL
ncbi:hypothetical protein [Paenibacillus lactis]|uniref:hypothetical protein n=1 Tax=Paenibacillus lactis TaxID=228574 RepID=UPI001B2EEE6C|nr:hypothetical protein [Paenibacillus lactis]GIO93025.1 hypothetical protein J31TS3_42520 [Paenibacillus lactis]